MKTEAKEKSNFSPAILKLEEFLPIRAKLKEQGKKLVFTNGCFDLIHIGHIRYLKKAKELGDFLLVAINSDSSIKKIKGPNRPIINEVERAEIIASLKFVDFVIIFSETTPQRIIQKILPDILVKGSDWKIEEIVGREIVEKNGGKVLTIPLVEGASTSSIIEKIIKIYSANSSA